jgi:hypothetical protein
MWWFLRLDGDVTLINEVFDGFDGKPFGEAPGPSSSLVSGGRHILPTDPDSPSHTLACGNRSVHYHLILWSHHVHGSDWSGSTWKKAIAICMEGEPGMQLGLQLDFEDTCSPLRYATLRLDLSVASETINSLEESCHQNSTWRVQALPPALRYRLFVHQLLHLAL